MDDKLFEFAYNMAFRDATLRKAFVKNFAGDNIKIRKEKIKKNGI